MDIKLIQITKFNDLNFFSYEDKREEKCFYARKNQWSKPMLALNKNGELVIHFQNKIEHFFHSIVHGVLKRLGIAHTTTNPETVWNALKRINLVQENEKLPTQDRKQIRNAFSEKVHQYVHGDISRSSKTFQIAKPANQDILAEAVFYLTEYDAENVKKVFDPKKMDVNSSLRDLDTPLTLALKHENFEVVQYLLSLKDNKGIAIVNPNLCVKNGQTPLVVAAKKDLPRKFFIELFQAGAAPQNDQEANEIITAAGGEQDVSANRRLIQAIKDLQNGKEVSWPAPRTEA